MRSGRDRAPADAAVRARDEGAADDSRRSPLAHLANRRRAGDESTSSRLDCVTCPFRARLKCVARTTFERIVTVSVACSAGSRDVWRQMAADSDLSRGHDHQWASAHHVSNCKLLTASDFCFAINRFKNGAFIPGVPVQPIILRWKPVRTTTACLLAREFSSQMLLASAASSA